MTRSNHHSNTPLAVAAPHATTCICASNAGRLSSDASTTAAAHCQVSAQLSEELSQQLSGLVGRAFSHTEEGFEVLVPASTVAAGTAESADADLAAAELLLPAAPLAVPGSPSTAEEEEDEEESLYWGSPMKHESAGMAAAAAAAIAAAADSQLQQHLEADLAQLKGPAPAAAMAASEPEAAALVDTALASSMLNGIKSVATAQEDMPEQPCEQSLAAVVTPTATAVAAAAPGAPPAATPAASFTSFKEISRMISASEISPSHSHSNSRRGSALGLGVPNLAARLLDEGGTWGTPREGSSWGTPREHQHGTEVAAANQHDTAEDAAEAKLARSRRCSSEAGIPAHLVLQAKLEAAAEQRLQQPQTESEEGSSAEIPLSIRQAAAAEPAAGVPPSYDQLDFTIAAAVDVQPMPASRNSRRSSRELYRVRLYAC